ncbi:MULTISPECIES: Rrf2 family transcriptional regulator [unclassified Campylobacter]|uniref:Rrf2 family transcriptional regulator n=1 Tax=unclassified Campylobacter TaxID=2593542 RepID=UPI001BD953BB|nr:MULTISPECIES: Rrf2 family transcriptional regulator [unclassified Campylobacter]MBZ7975899.1 Rrf2 family transcriptional regulator [Campylobacter sp. RM12637]MBZ7977469.1 Rrf2 family transcriptional regulator [Campylobacter sp. RM12654]MBZ7979562.1 Rrf2 family transcriptional regulator [Campylobacter sp. RM12642]MBZ7981121.1 Rrf2 family transcriptional regulator [Campylobacter sp. RM12640]MBZ7982962.1 Rrf2 family transcriptional regulator [Campylobacter sp. RM12647]MBZ7989294.1 Rrf2 family
MLFTRASEYALISLIYIAKHKSPIDVDTLASELNIPRSFLAKILQNLARAHILKSYKGINGGFILAKEPNLINIKDVIISAEKKEPLVFECTGDDKCPSNRHDTCKIYPIITNLQDKINSFLTDITLEQILK